MDVLNDITEIIQSVRKQIETEHQMGDQAGGSGHLSYITHVLGDLKIEIIEKNKKTVTFWYTLYVETEFTIEPYNPPFEYKYCKRLIIDLKNKKLITGNDSDESPFEGNRDAQIENISDILKTVNKKRRENGKQNLHLQSPPIFIEYINKNFHEDLVYLDLVVGSERKPIFFQLKYNSEKFNELFNQLFTF